MIETVNTINFGSIKLKIDVLIEIDKNHQNEIDVFEEKLVCTIVTLAQIHMVITAISVVIFFLNGSIPKTIDSHLKSYFIFHFLFFKR